MMLPSQSMADPNMVSPSIAQTPNMTQKEVDAILDDQTDIELLQEHHVIKGLCLFCIPEDRFAVNTKIKSELIETSTWSERNINPCCFFPCQKPAVYQYDVGSMNTMRYIQEFSCMALSGAVANVNVKGREIGQVGLPKAACDDFDCCGSYDCAINCTSWGGICCHRCGYGCCSKACCICMGLNCNPTRIIDHNDDIIHNVIADACQMSMLCPSAICCFDTCLTTQYQVLHMDNRLFAKITRYDNRECWICRPSNKFTIHFPPKTQRHLKQLLFASAISLHYLYHDN